MYALAGEGVVARVPEAALARMEGEPGRVVWAAPAGVGAQGKHLGGAAPLQDLQLMLLTTAGLLPLLLLLIHVNVYPNFDA